MSYFWGVPMGFSLETGGNDLWPDYAIWQADQSTSPYLSPKPMQFATKAFTNIQILSNGVKYDPNQTYDAPLIPDDPTVKWILMNDTSGGRSMVVFIGGIEGKRVYFFVNNRNGATNRLYRVMGRVESATSTYNPSFEEKYIEASVKLSLLTNTWTFVKTF